MGEPLKDKIIAQPTDFTSIEPIFLVKDVKSAVEYLKDIVKGMDIPKGKNGVLESIDVAFPDLPPDSLMEKCFNIQCLDYKENKCYGDEPENCDRRIVNTLSNENKKEAD
ncbi:hypothetical protein LCGC14_0844140 [marine sediment metagenome]|uniref:Uncharacterized protein n=1 Tax=marine sediment metagenome TaxID=412755 RepID=A0A0F9PH18_9ZZZZ